MVRADTEAGYVVLTALDRSRSCSVLQKVTIHRLFHCVEQQLMRRAVNDNDDLLTRARMLLVRMCGVTPPRPLIGPILQAIFDAIQNSPVSQSAFVSDFRLTSGIVVESTAAGPSFGPRYVRPLDLGSGVVADFYLFLFLFLFLFGIISVLL